MRRLRISLPVLSLLALGGLAGGCFAQSAEELESPAVNRIADALELSVRLQDQHGLPHGPVSLQNLLGQQEKNPPDGAGRDVGPGHSGFIR